MPFNTIKNGTILQIPNGVHPLVAAGAFPPPFGSGCRYSFKYVFDLSRSSILSNIDSMRLNVEVKTVLYKEFWHLAAGEGYGSISEAVRGLMIDYVKRRKAEEGVISIPSEDDKDERATSAS